MLGAPGLMRSWRAGKVALANAPGAGVADDKVVFAYVPKMIKYYLDEDPILPNVPSYLCHNARERKYVLEILERNNGNRTQTARDLGVDPRTIFRYLEREANPMPSGAGGSGPGSGGSP